MLRDPFAPGRYANRSASPRVQALLTQVEAMRHDDANMNDDDESMTLRECAEAAARQNPLEMATVMPQQRAADCLTPAALKETAPPSDSVETGLDSTSLSPITVASKSDSVGRTSWRSLAFPGGISGPLDDLSNNGPCCAEAWLRLARLVLLEDNVLMSIPKPPQVCAMSRHEPTDVGALETKVNSSCSDNSTQAKTTEESVDAWARMVSRVLILSSVGDPEENLEDSVEETPEEAPEDRFPPKYRNGHLCLGAMMQESVTWIEVDPEDDYNSPKHSDQIANEIPEADEHENDGRVPPHMRDISRQQKAGGIVEGMPKCLSF